MVQTRTSLHRSNLPHSSGTMTKIVFRGRTFLNAVVRGMAAPALIYKDKGELIADGAINEFQPLQVPEPRERGSEWIRVGNYLRHAATKEASAEGPSATPIDR